MWWPDGMHACVPAHPLEIPLKIPWEIPLGNPLGNPGGSPASTRRVVRARTCAPAALATDLGSTDLLHKGVWHGFRAF
jgi:hypothetical protein